MGCCELARQVAVGPVQLRYARLLTGRAAYSVVRRLVHPRAYAAVGIPPQTGRTGRPGEPALAGDAALGRPQAVRVARRARPGRRSLPGPLATGRPDLTARQPDL